MSGSSPFTVHRRLLGPMGNFVYLIEDHASRRAAVVDPAWDVPAIVELAEGLGVVVTDVLLTHSHQDHVNGLVELLGHYDAQVHLLRAEADFWGSFQDVPTLHHGGEVIELGETVVDVWHTPGHTPGSACYHVGGSVITGDTLFVFGCGRCDLAGGDAEVMFDTLRRLVECVPDAALLYPGHDYGVMSVSSMAEQKVGNPFLHFREVGDFVRYRLYEHDCVRDTPYAPVLSDNFLVGG